MSAPRAVSFRNRREERLAGVLHGDVGRTVAICCHGMLSTKDSAKHTAIAEALWQEGIAALRFDFAACGESEGSFGETSYSTRVADLQAAIEYLAGLGAERFLLFGSSMGGAVALLAAAREERVKAVATLAAVGYPAAIAERHPEMVAAVREQGFVDTPQGRLGPTFIEDALAHDVLAAVRVLFAPVLAIHGGEDEVVPVTDAHDIATAARNASLLLFDGADHRFSDPAHLEPAITEIVDFLKRAS